MARRLAAEEGLLASGSTGLDVTGALQLATEIGARSGVDSSVTGSSCICR